MYVTKKFARSFSRCKGFAHDVRDVNELALHLLWEENYQRVCVHRDQGRTLLSQAPWLFIYTYV